MGYKILYVQSSDSLRLYLDNIKVIRADDDILISIADIQMIVLDNYKLVLSTQLINKLVENNVSLVICGLDHLPNAVILPVNGYYASSGMMMEQIEWSDEIKDKLTQKIIKAKINNQIEVLYKNKLEQEVCIKLKEYYNEVDLGDVTNREGLAAKVYFKELFGPSFIRFDETVVNAGLNYGYSIFRSLISTLLVGKGLTPNLGLFHKSKTNRFNLSDDFIEVFRPIVDDYVFNHLRYSDFLTFEDRQNLIGLTAKKVQIGGKWQTIHNAINQYIDSIISCIRNDSVEEFVFPTLITKDDV